MTLLRRAAPGFRFFVLTLFLFGMSAAKAAVPAFAQVQQEFRSSYAELLDREGRLLHARRLDLQVNRLAWVRLEDISPALQEAVVFGEDRDFYRHRGVDWGATARATLKLLGGDRSRGASTISMQLAGLLDGELAWRRGGRSVGNKWKQMRAAQRLEKTWSKAQILEAWLNLVTFRGDLQGIGAASAALFGKSPAGLDRNEALLLAALLPSPNATAARVAKRACTLVEAGFAGANCQSVRDLALLQLDRRRAPYPESPALDALAVRLLSTPGERLRTTLDAGLQRQAEDILATQLAELDERYVNAGAVLVLDNASGEVRAYVANAGRVATARFVDGVQARRQAGSTLKPFLYALALDRRYLTAASVLEDAPLSLSTPTGLYTPQNYEKDFKGPVSVRVALAGSLNVPAVRVLDLVGVEDFWRVLRGVGYDSLTEAPDFYGYALALGSADVSLWTQANAFRTLANGGRFSPATLLPGPAAEPEPVLGAPASFVVADILADRGARAITFGLENPLATPFWSAVKTGTSKDMRDNWCIGFSRRHTVAVWVGNLDGAPMRDVSGVSGAAPVWAGLMHALEGGRVHPGGDLPAAPAGVVHQRVEFAGLTEPPRSEWFLDGTQMQRVEFVTAAAARIAYPAPETLVALDPDIPVARQRLRFRAEAVGQGVDWWLDGRRLGLARDLDWLPQPGGHRLELRDSAGRVLDTVPFTVRGRALSR
ncbi:MAG: putative penicillin-binding protein [Moraxellaceae bacterium]|jgi:penicillin-binding protein 1C|nr:putative penicillin-binding protein [Moraxellaceae bacterium]